MLGATAVAVRNATNAARTTTSEGLPKEKIETLHLACEAVEKWLNYSIVRSFYDECRHSIGTKPYFFSNSADLRWVFRTVCKSTQN